MGIDPGALDSIEITKTHEKDKKPFRNCATPKLVHFGGGVVYSTVVIKILSKF